MKLDQTLDIYGSGTSEGAKKAWDTMGRGRKTKGQKKTIKKTVDNLEPELSYDTMVEGHMQWLKDSVYLYDKINTEPLKWGSDQEPPGSMTQVAHNLAIAGANPQFFKDNPVRIILNAPDHIMARWNANGLYNPSQQMDSAATPFFIWDDEKDLPEILVLGGRNNAEESSTLTHELGHHIGFKSAHGDMGTMAQDGISNSGVLIGGKFVTSDDAIPAYREFNKTKNEGRTIVQNVLAENYLNQVPEDRIGWRQINTAMENIASSQFPSPALKSRAQLFTGKLPSFYALHNFYEWFAESFRVYADPIIRLRENFRERNPYTAKLIANTMKRSYKK